MFALIYICPTHGETWHVERTETCDTENDEVYEFMVCSICGLEVKPLMRDGVQICHALTDEEMFWEMCACDDAA
jgi:hypothetical protein